MAEVTIKFTDSFDLSRVTIASEPTLEQLLELAQEAHGAGKTLTTAQALGLIALQAVHARARWEPEAETVNEQ